MVGAQQTIMVQPLHNKLHTHKRLSNLAICQAIQTVRLQRTGNTTIHKSIFNLINGPTAMVGYRPVMNSSWGISCAPAGFFPNMNNGYGYYGYSYRNVYYGQYYAQNGQWSSIPQVAYNPAVYGANSNCYATAASVCDIRSNNCPGGSVCRATSGGSYLGICTYGTGVEYYGGGTAR